MLLCAYPVKASNIHNRSCFEREHCCVAVFSPYVSSIFIGTFDTFIHFLGFIFNTKFLPGPLIPICLACRTRKLLVRALRAIPLVVDHDPLDVVYEDKALLAVNKPPFVTTSPRHRWQGGTMVNRALGYLGYEPKVVHRLDMNTTGVLVVAKSTVAAAHIQRQFK